MKDINIFLNQEGWDFVEMQGIILEGVIEHVQSCMRHVKQTNYADKPWWTKTSSGQFTVKSSQELIRGRGDIMKDMKSIWLKGIIFKYFPNQEDFECKNSIVCYDESLES